ncbi:MAG TPA: DUF1080 domain-containing protein [Luteimonas sp.]|nr:DUF1080 domain-containing protein [Luteimonas sp.]
MQRHLKAWLAACMACVAAAGTAHAAEGDAVADALVGRWDIDIHAPGGDLPSWLEVRRSGTRTLVGEFVGVVGSARPVSRVEVDGETLRFSLPPQWEGGAGDFSFEGRLRGDGLAGTMAFPDGRRFDWSARRAPSLQRSSPPEWGEPVRLFNGRDLSGWRATGPSNWQAADGVLRNTGSGANLVTERTFTDFRLHVELRLPKGSNSGVYLRGRYEVQVADRFGEPASDTLGAVYGFLAPSEEAARGPEEWQSLDITLVGRRITVAVNGKTVVCDREIPGITGGALDSDEGAPGPLLLQGDHGPVEFRNITLTPAR